MTTSASRKADYLQRPLLLQNILGYNIERIPTESTAGGTLMYISQKLLHKLRSDLKIYSPKELESTCVEIFISNKQNLTVGTI